MSFRFLRARKLLYRGRVFEESVKYNSWKGGGEGIYQKTNRGDGLIWRDDDLYGLYIYICIRRGGLGRDDGGCSMR